MLGHYLVGEAARSLFGDERLAGANDTQLVFGTGAVVAGRLFGEVKLLAAAGVGGLATGAGLGTSFVTSLALSFARFALELDNGTDITLDAASLVIDAAARRVTGPLRGLLFISERYRHQDRAGSTVFCFGL